MAHSTLTPVFVGLRTGLHVLFAALLVLPTLPVLLGYVVFVIVLAVVAGTRLAARA
ncbi:hypothetical protein IAE22_28275 [Bacillus sp. S34]|nr:hypothetical protein [Bacillus sp. S34]